MKNLKLLTGTAVLAGLLLTTGCVKNEEADGVKALRQAQAALINAEASHKTALTEADVAYRNAEAALKQAEAESQVIQNEIDQLVVALNSSNNALIIAKNEAEIAQLQAKQEKLVEAAIAGAEKELADAQTELQKSLISLAEETAKSESAAVKEYYKEYAAALDSVTKLQSEILGLNTQISRASLYKSEDENGFTTRLETEKAQQERMLAKLEDWKARYEAIVGNPENILAEMTDAQEDSANIQSEIDDLDLEIDDADAAVDKAEELMDSIYDVYTMALQAEMHVANINNQENYPFTIAGPYGEFVSKEEIGEYIDNPEAAGLGWDETTTFNSIPYYELQLENAELALTASETKLTKAQALKEIYADDLADLIEAVAVAEEAVTVAEHDYNLAEVEAETYPDDQAAQDAFSDADQNLTDARDALNEAVTNLDDFKNNINAASILESDYYYITWTSEGNIDDIDLLIAHYEEEIIFNQDVIDDIELRMLVVDGLLDYLNDVGRVSDINSLKSDYFAAKDVRDNAYADRRVLYGERQLLLLDKTAINNFLSDLRSEKVAVVNGLNKIEDDIDNVKDAIATIEVALVDAENYLEELNVKLAEKEDKLAVWQEEVEYFHALIQAELGTEE